MFAFVIEIYTFHLTFTILGANLAENKLVIFFLVFPENRIWHFMQIISIGDNLHEMLNPVFMEKYEKIHQFVICWISSEW